MHDILLPSGDMVIRVLVGVLRKKIPKYDLIEVCIHMLE